MFMFITYQVKRPPLKEVGVKPEFQLKLKKLQLPSVRVLFLCHESRDLFLTTSFFHTQLLWWERCAERNATRLIVSNLVSSWDYTIQCFPHYVTSECCFKCQPSSTTIQMDMFNCRKEKKKETTAASLERHLLHKQWVSNLKCTKKEP